MNDSEIINKLGGTGEVALLCAVTPQAVSQWREDGIPQARKMYLKLLRPDVFGISANSDHSPTKEAA